MTAQKKNPQPDGNLIGQGGKTHERKNRNKPSRAGCDPG